MAEDKTKVNEDDMFKGGIYPLTDLETGEQVNFRFLAQADLDGNTYYAFVPVEEEENEEQQFVILKVLSTDGDDIDLVDIESDEELLSAGVPKTLTIYKSKVIERMIRQQQDRLSDESLSEAEHDEALRQIAHLNNVKMRLANKIQRLIL